MKIFSRLGHVLLICSSLIIAIPAHSADSSTTTKAGVKKTVKKQELSANSALVIDLKTNEIIYSNNPDAVKPIASVTKLMTAIVTLDAKLPMDAKLPITIKDAKEMKGVHSRVKIGSEISRKDMLLLTLMSSENRAAASLAHHYPGGYKAFIKAMNAKAKALGMKNTRFVEPTGLSAKNVSTARDLVVLLKASKKYPLLGKLSATDKKPSPFLNLDTRSISVTRTDWCTTTIGKLTSQKPDSPMPQDIVLSCAHRWVDAKLPSSYWILKANFHPSVMPIVYVLG